MGDADEETFAPSASRQYVHGDARFSERIRNIRARSHPRTVRAESCRVSLAKRVSLAIVAEVRFWIFSPHEEDPRQSTEIQRLAAELLWAVAHAIFVSRNVERAKVVDGGLGLPCRAGLHAHVRDMRSRLAAHVLGRALPARSTFVLRL
jgi:hypothetical protein